MINAEKFPARKQVFPQDRFYYTNPSAVWKFCEWNSFWLYLFNYPDLIKPSIIFPGTEMMRWDSMVCNFWNLLSFPLPPLTVQLCNLSSNLWGGHSASLPAMPLFHSLFPSEFSDEYWRILVIYSIWVPESYSRTEPFRDKDALEFPMKNTCAIEM